MPKKKRPEEDPTEQFKRFVDAANKSGVDEKTAEGAFKRLKPKADNSSTDRPAKPEVKSR